MEPDPSIVPDGRRDGDARRAGRPPERFGLLLAILTIAFMVSGVDERWAQAVGIGLTVVVAWVGFRHAGYSSSRPLLWSMCAVALGATLSISVLRDDTPWRAVPMFVQALVLGVLVVLAVRSALRQSVVDMQTILAAISAYVLIGFSYAWLYFGLDVVDDQQFSMPSTDGTSFFEFSFVVQTTLGFGNQLPTSSFAARVVVTQAVIGQMFLATLVARLVTLYGTNARARPTARQ